MSCFLRMSTLPLSGSYTTALSQLPLRLTRLMAGSLCVELSLCAFGIIETYKNSEDDTINQNQVEEGSLPRQ